MHATQYDRPTQPPPPDEAAALADFEAVLRAYGEQTARDANLRRVAEPMLRREAARYGRAY